MAQLVTTSILTLGDYAGRTPTWLGVLAIFTTNAKTILEAGLPFSKMVSPTEGTSHSIEWFSLLDHNRHIALYDLFLLVPLFRMHRKSTTSLSVKAQDGILSTNLLILEQHEPFEISTMNNVINWQGKDYDYQGNPWNRPYQASFQDNPQWNPRHRTSTLCDGLVVLCYFILFIYLFKLYIFILNTLRKRDVRRGGGKTMMNTREKGTI